MRPRQVDIAGTHPRGVTAYASGVSTRGTLPFDAKKIGEEIEAARVRLGIPVEVIAARVGLSNRPHWYAKVSGDKPFRWEQAAKCAREFGAPRGWPIVPWHEGLAWEKWLEEEGHPAGA
jgi:hypothetical protein